jgi:hypothetical protein
MELTVRGADDAKRVQSEALASHEVRTMADRAVLREE